MSIKIKKLSKTQVSLIIIVILGLTFGGYFYFRNNQKISPSLPTSTVNTGDGINYSPPSTEDKAEVNQNKTKIADGSKDSDTKTQPSGASSTSSKKTANPIISSWGQSPDKQTVFVSGYISDVYEDGGTCTVELVKSSVTVKQSQIARKDAQVTTCGQIRVDRSRLSAGTWTATIIYSSAAAYGKSDPEKVPVI